MIVHGHVALTLLIVVVIPVVVVATSLDTCIEMSIVGILIAGTQSEEVANGVTKAQAELPRRIEFELIGFARAVLATCVVEHFRIVGSLEVIPGRSCHRETHAERRSLDRTEDDTSCDVGTCTINTALIGHSQLIVAIRTTQLLDILAIVTIVNVAQSDGHTQIDTIVDVAADVEVVGTYIAFMCTVECIARSWIVAPHVIVVQPTCIDVVKLIARNIGTIEVRHVVQLAILDDGLAIALFVEDAVIALGNINGRHISLVVCELVLRGIVQTIGSRKDKVEVTALMVVETEVDE